MKMTVREWENLQCDLDDLIAAHPEQTARAGLLIDLIETCTYGKSYAASVAIRIDERQQAVIDAAKEHQNVLAFSRQPRRQRPNP